MTEIKRIGVLSLAKIIGLIYMVIGLIVWLLMGCFMLFAVMANPSETPAESMVIFCFVCIVPFFYGAIGFAGGAIIAAIYNLIAGKIGGIEVELAPADEPEIVMNVKEPL